MPMTYSLRDCMEAIEAAADYHGIDKNGKITVEMYNDYRDSAREKESVNKIPSEKVITRRFAGWNEAVWWAGYRSGDMPYTTEECVEAPNIVADHLGLEKGELLTVEMFKNGREEILEEDPQAVIPSYYKINKDVGWGRTVSKAGYRLGRKREYSTKDCIEAAVNAAAYHGLEKGETLTWEMFNDFREHTKDGDCKSSVPCKKVIYRAFSNWDEFVWWAGYKSGPGGYGKHCYTPKDCVDAIETVAEHIGLEKGDEITFPMYKAAENELSKEGHDLPKPGTIYSKFAGWAEAVFWAGYKPCSHKGMNFISPSPGSEKWDNWGVPRDRESIFTDPEFVEDLMDIGG